MTKNSYIYKKYPNLLLFDYFIKKKNILQYLNCSDNFFDYLIYLKKNITVSQLQWQIICFKFSLQPI